MSKSIKIMIAGLAGATMLATAANAGGFSRGTADTDILYEDGNFVSRSGITVVSPNFNVTYAGGASSGEVADTYIIPSFAMMVRPVDNFACAGTFTQSFGGASDYSGTTIGYDSDALGTVSQSFSANELAATCAAQFSFGSSRVSLLGGVFLQSFDFEQVVGGPFNPGVGTAVLKLKDTGYGYRIGAAYEIPEIALRAQLMYRSAVKVDAEGTFETLTGFVLNPAASGNGEFPQSVELKLQTGVAPGWLVYGSVKWTEWSVFETLDYVAAAPAQLDFFYNDGWTVQAGVAHQFTETLAGTANITWDQGVGTGYDLRGADTWTLAVGGSYKPNDRAEIRGGVGVSFFGSDAQTLGNDPTKTSDAGTALAGNVSIKLKF